MLFCWIGGTSRALAPAPSIGSVHDIAQFATPLVASNSFRSSARSNLLGTSNRKVTQHPLALSFPAFSRGGSLCTLLVRGER